MRKIITALAAAAALAAPAFARRHDSPEVQLEKLLAGREAGKPASCISLPWTQESHIIPGKAIVYRQGGTLWVNYPRGGAQSLRDDDLLVTKSFGGQLCRIDTVTLVDRAAHFQRGFVVLGDFVPYRLPKKG